MVGVSTCGWYTYTTKERINHLLPPGIGVFQSKSKWYVSYKGKNGLIPFVDGMSV